MLVIVEFQKSSLGIRIGGRGLEVSNAVSTFGFLFAGIIEDAIPIGRCIHSRICALATRAKHHPFDRLYRSEEHALATFLSVNEDLHHTIGYG